MNKEVYKKLSTQLTDLPVFMRYEWLNAIYCSWEWKVEVVEKGGEVFGVMPYFIKKKLGLTFIGHPPLVPYLGVYIRYPEDQKENRRLSFEKEILTSLLEKLPKFSSYAVKFQLKPINLLPLHWSNFKVLTRFTYVIEKPGSRDAILSNADQQIRRQVKKAEQLISVEESNEVQELMKLKKESYREKGMSLPFNDNYIQEIFDACKHNNFGKLLIAKDSNNTVKAAIIVVWDNEYCHYLIGASDVKEKGTGAMSLLMLEALQLSASKNLSFNFEGSMVPSIERYFRNFGGVQVPVYQAEKTNSFLIKAYKTLKNS